MEKILHLATERGKGDYGWLQTRYSFSFANWYDPRRMGFGVLRVINDDAISPDSGFDTHTHRDMEIITIVLKGTVTHMDSIGNTGTVAAGEVQTMSAGTGVMHSEKNASPDEALMLFQIWIEPNEKGVLPRYAQKPFDFTELANGLTLLVSPDEREGSLPIHQEAFISYAVVTQEAPLSYEPKRKGNGLYVFVVEGLLDIADEHLRRRDAIGLVDTEQIELSTPSSAIALIIDVPLS